MSYVIWLILDLAARSLPVMDIMDTIYSVCQGTVCDEKCKNDEGMLFSFKEGQSWRLIKQFKLRAPLAPKHHTLVKKVLKIHETS